MSPTRINLGCSDHNPGDFWNVDLVQPCDEIADLSKPWPWGSSSVEIVRSWDIFEHIENRIHVMNECHRVLKPGGRLDLFIPTSDGRGADQDPTHVSRWNCNSLFYFCEQFAEWQRFHESYGITANFRIVTTNGRAEWPVEDVPWTGDMALIQESPVHILFPDNVWKLKVLLEAVK